MRISSTAANWPVSPSSSPHGRGVVDDVAAEDLGPPGVRGEQRREHADQGRLAGAVRSEQPEDGPLLDLEVDPGERSRRTEALDHALDMDGARAAIGTRVRHAAIAIAMIGPVTATCCQLSPRSRLRSNRPSAMPQTRSSARTPSAYGIDSPGMGSSRQESPSQR